MRVIVILNSKEEVEIILERVVKEQSPQVSESEPMAERLSCNNLWVEIVERNFSKNFLKKNLFVVLSFSAHIQGPIPWWKEKAKHL